MSSEGWTDQMEANTSWTLGWPLSNQRDGWWLAPQVVVIPVLKCPGQLLSLQLEGSDLQC